jgi:large subunit ribosomal protein LX
LDFWSDVMAEYTYKVSGQFKEGEEWRAYEKTVTAPNEDLAREWIYTTIGSKHRLKRNYITIDSVTLNEG